MSTTVMSLQIEKFRFRALTGCGMSDSVGLKCGKRVSEKRIYIKYWGTNVLTQGCITPC